MERSAAPAPLIRLDAVVLGYGAPLMRPLDWAVQRGEFWGVVGPNGAGKSTLARTLLGLLRPLGGRLELMPPALRFGYVPQRHAVGQGFPVSVLDVTLMGRYDRRSPGRRLTEEDRGRTREELARLGMAPHADRLFSALSGGQQQRVLLARALASDPDVLLLDEPTEGMDLPGAADILLFLQRLPGERGLTVVMIGHHLDEVLGAADHLALINKDTDLFEAGPVAELLDAARLSRLYGRPMATHTCEGRLHIHVEGRQAAFHGADDADRARRQHIRTINDDAPAHEVR